jgi:type II secretory pathway pseudopilin PulG
MPCPFTKRFCGFTLVELLVSISIVILIIGFTLVIINPPQIYARARDTQRISDLSNLSVIVEQFITDNGSPPTISNSTRLSDHLPLGNGGPLQSVTSGWIEGNFSKYASKLFTDPLNEGDFVYRYKSDGIGYEIDCQMETLVDKMEQDKGNSLTRYEIGTNLELL